LPYFRLPGVAMECPAPHASIWRRHAAGDGPIS
jgi:hypothetical protein